MKRYISAHDRKYYTYMLEVLLALGGKDMQYKWLISSIEAYPKTRGKYVDLIEKSAYVILANAELMEMLTEDDFQWVWAVFSAIPANISNEEILRYELPSAENKAIYRKDAAMIQHPLAELEIVAFDSSYVFMVSKNEQMAERFKDLYPMSSPNF